MTRKILLISYFYLPYNTPASYRLAGFARALLERGFDVHILTSRTQRVHEDVDLTLDFVGAPYWEKNLGVLRRGGRLVLIGFLGGSRGELDLGPLMRKNLTVRGTTLRATPIETKAKVIREFYEFAIPRFEDGRLRAVVDRVFPMTEAAAAHVYMAENRNAGKIVLTVP